MRKFILSLLTIAALLGMSKDLLAASSVKIGGAQLSDYVIVYGDSEDPDQGLNVAKSLQEYIKDKAGVTLEITTDKSAPAPCEIVVGRTSRAYASMAAARPVATFDYIVECSKNSLVIRGGGGWALTKACSIVADALSSKKGIKEGWSKSGTVFGEELFPREKGADLRILDVNVWEYVHDTIPQWWREHNLDCRDAYRGPRFVQLIRAYMPDVVCIQEYARHLDDVMRPMLAEYGYKLAYLPGPDDQWSFTPIYYRPEAVALEYSQYHRYTPEMWSNHGTKSYNVAVFTLKSSGKRFIVGNTHLWWKSDKAQPGSTQARTEQCTLLADTVEALEKEWNCPSFVMGDMNGNLSTAPMKVFLERNYIPCPWAASVYGDPSSGHHKADKGGYGRTLFSPIQERGMGAIDQFFIHNQGSVDVKVFKRINAMFTDELTDHYPNYMDASL
ncbi:MAG: endonuclease/exonuclease/phosphatase family protein [Bacteroidales bacterium]|nr:endonuclease/exonuclease/phosphatase family protein [Bacteroidales bacterium]